MNNILIAMFMLICVLGVFLIYTINKLMELQYDLIEQHDEIRKIAFTTYEIQEEIIKEMNAELGKNERSLYDINHNIDILHDLLNDYSNTILMSIAKSKCDINAINSYLEIMKETILDMNERMNKPTYGLEVSDKEDTENNAEEAI